MGYCFSTKLCRYIINVYTFCNIRSKKNVSLQIYNTALVVLWLKRWYLFIGIAFLTSFLRECHSNAIYMYEIWIRENLITIGAPKTAYLHCRFWLKLSGHITVSREAHCYQLANENYLLCLLEQGQCSSVLWSPPMHPKT